VITVGDLQDVLRVRIGAYLQNLVADVMALTLNQLLTKCPYQRALRYTNAQDVLKDLVQAFVASSEETRFGNFFEEVALAIGQHRTGTMIEKIDSLAEGLPGIDLRVSRPGEVFLLSCKTASKGWRNSGQTRDQELRFIQAKRKTLGSSPDDRVFGVMAYAVGDSNGTWLAWQMSEGLDFSIYGQAYWAWLSGDPSFYKDLIHLFEQAPKNHLDISGLVDRLLSDMQYLGYAAPDGSMDLSLIHI